ncbi:MAG: Uncharacterised protein [Owenweeksia sp. TMED14]|nr:MAG: Uncharacterised protein [Owenweeksia sp. TMED14]
MTVFAQALLPFVSSHLVAFSFFTARHNFTYLNETIIELYILPIDFPLENSTS